MLAQGRGQPSPTRRICGLSNALLVGALHGVRPSSLLDGRYQLIVLYFGERVIKMMQQLFPIWMRPTQSLSLNSWI